MKCSFVGLNLVTPDVGMISLHVHVGAAEESELMSVPGGNMEMEATIFMLLLTDSRVMQLVTLVRTGVFLQELKSVFSTNWALRIGEEYRLGTIAEFFGFPSRFT